jgi:hypothetical protein
MNERLTIRKTAPSITAFMRTSRSMGNETPKLSVSVKASFNKPDHCLEILPTFWPVVADFTCRISQKIEDTQEIQKKKCNWLSNERGKRKGGTYGELNVTAH